MAIPNNSCIDCDCRQVYNMVIGYVLLTCVKQGRMIHVLRDTSSLFPFLINRDPGPLFSLFLLKLMPPKAILTHPNVLSSSAKENYKRGYGKMEKGFRSISLCLPTFLEEFEQYAEKAKTLPDTTTNENLLILYGLYKQANVGNVNTSRPGMFDMKGKAKWDAWKANEGKPQEEAMNDYITKVKQLLEEAGLPA